MRSGEPLVDADPDGNSIPASIYPVNGTDLPRFRSFLRFMTSARPVLSGSSLAESAARRYLRGMFISGPFPDVADPDDQEDALLQLTFGLEKLLMADEQAAIGDKIALRAACLVGFDDDKRREHVYSAVKKLYDDPSGIVHGRARKRAGMNAAWRARELARDILVAFVAIRRRIESDDQWRDILRRLPVSRAEQVRAARLVRRPLRLVRSGH